MKKANQLYHQGISLYGEGRWDDAIDVFSEALEIYRERGKRNCMDRTLHYLDQCWRQVW